MANTYIHTPYSRSGEHNDGFWSDALKRHLQSQPDKGIAIGKSIKPLPELPKSTLEYFIRNHFVKDITTRQVVDSVLEELLATGDFEIKEVKSPNRGRNPQWIFLK